MHDVDTAGDHSACWIERESRGQRRRDREDSAARVGVGGDVDRLAGGDGDVVVFESLWRGRRGDAHGNLNAQFAEACGDPHFAGSDGVDVADVVDRHRRRVAR